MNKFDEYTKVIDEIRATKNDSDLNEVNCAITDFKTNFPNESILIKQLHQTVYDQKIRLEFEKICD